MNVRSPRAFHAGHAGEGRARSARLAVTAALMVLAAAAAPALAQSRPDARQMSCDETQRLVRQHGSVVITTGQFTYQRFVANAGYCDFYERARQEYVETVDTDVCPISYVCERKLELWGR